MNKNYIIYNNDKVGYIEDICNCIKCKERKQTEIFINDLSGRYLDCITLEDIEEIIYLGESLEECISVLIEHYKNIINTKEKEKKYLQEIIKLYESKCL